MRAQARVVAEADGRGGTRLAVLRSEAPLVLRETPAALYLIGGAGGPLGGDDLSLDIDVGTGARLTIRSAAAALAQPGLGPGRSRLRVRATVAGGGELRWLPEPLVAVRGCVHETDATVALAADARLTWREELILGRHREAPGSVVARASIDRNGWPLLRHEVALGADHPLAGGPAVTAGARAVGSVVVVKPDWTAPAVPLGPTAAVLSLAAPGAALVVALAASASELRRQLDEGTRACRTQAAGADRASRFCERETGRQIVVEHE